MEVKVILSGYPLINLERISLSILPRCIYYVEDVPDIFAPGRTLRNLVFLRFQAAIPNLFKSGNVKALVNIEGRA